MGRIIHHIVSNQSTICATQRHVPGFKLLRRSLLGSRGLDVDAFVTADQAASVINGITTFQRHNYDYAFDAVYQLGAAILAQNAQDGEERDLFCHLSCPTARRFQYN